MSAVMVVAEATIDAAFDSFIKQYGTLKRKAWDIKVHVDMYVLSESAFAGDGQPDKFSTIYGNLDGYWQALRPRPRGTWDADTTYRNLRELNPDVRLKRLSALGTADWPGVWDCIYRMRNLKPNKSGASVVAISKFLHFWNPRLFVIVDVAMMANWVLGHRWLAAQLPKIEDLTPFPGAEEKRNAPLVWYLTVLQWTSTLVQENPHILTAFTRTVAARVGQDKLPKGIDAFDAPAVEWFLLGLVELPPAGVQLR
jgi:hypothetical protein